MINLSKKACKHFGIPWEDMEYHEGDSWRVDYVTIYRKKYLIVVHEATLFTLLLRATEYKEIKTVIAHIVMNCNWYRYDPDKLFIGKASDRKVTGSIVDMKQLIKSNQEINMNVIEINRFLNDTPFSAISGKKPFKAVLDYMKNDKIT